MRVTEHLAELRDIRRSLPGIFGLVPTMGALHEGHASLVARARAECDAVGVSIFVNPAQFGPGEDLGAYPRPRERDLALLESLGADLVWTPGAASLYAPGYQTWVTVEELTRPLEGTCRPGHFRGVATVVAKLFHAFTPDRAYFGQKDAQQVAVIRRMVRDLDFPLDVVVCPTVREPDGLALSSRNAYLDAEERRAAVVLFRALGAARALYDGGERGGAALRGAMRAELRSEPLAEEEYVSVAHPETLSELDRVEDGALLSLAVRIGRTRLIDNLALEGSGR